VKASTPHRDVAVVLSGGGMNAVLMELGFLKRLRDGDLWGRISVFFGTSAGALVGAMGAQDRLDDLEEFLYGLQPEETFRPNRLWRLPLLGTHVYVLPETIGERLGDLVTAARSLQDGPTELVVIVTDVTVDGESDGSRMFELAYSSRTSPPDEMAQAVLASAAISALVVPQLVGDRVATDGGWVRNYPLGYAYDREDIELIVGFRYDPTYSTLGAGVLTGVAGRLRRYARLPAAGMVHRELEAAVERERRGQPAHIVDIFSRLARVAIIRNTVVEELVAGWREQSVTELASLRSDVVSRLRAEGLDDLAEGVDRRFASAEFPFRHDRVVPRITVAGSAGAVTLEPGFRRPKPWTHEAKRELIERGYRLADDALRSAGPD
jgi:predicted acylesterase/phospholipase RssA